MLKYNYYILFIFSLCLVNFSAFGAKNKGYQGLTKNEVRKLLKVGCKESSHANCYELGLKYSLSSNTKTQALGNKYIKDACSNGINNACISMRGGSVGKTSQFLRWSSIALFGIAVLIITSMMFQDEDQYRAQSKLEDGSTGKGANEDHGIVLRYSRPMFKRYISPIVGSMKSKKWIKEKYKRKLSTAGLTNYITTDDFFSFKLFLIFGFPVMFLALRTFLEESWPLKLIPIIAVVGFIYPDIWIKGKMEQRQKAVISGMPFSVDMLALSVEAGLDFIAAMTKVIEKSKPNPLKDEFEILIKEIKIGASRAEALRNMAWRIDLIQISSFCATLIAADSVGASIGPILKSLSAEIRQKRSSDIEKAGATAATKILFPMLFLIVPAVFLIVGAPVGLEIFMGDK